MLRNKSFAISTRIFTLLKDKKIKTTKTLLKG